MAEIMLRKQNEMTVHENEVTINKNEIKKMTEHENEMKRLCNMAQTIWRKK